MKLNLSSEEKAKFLALAAKARKDNADDFLKVSAIDIMVGCIERGEMDDLEHSMLDLASLMTTGKELQPLRGKRKRKPPERKYKRGTGSY
jgi:hypothetical protein